MPTDKQIQASRTNGALSRGPVTEQGKRNSARNSTRHGLLSQTIVLQAEAADRFQDLLAGLMDEFQPSTATQVMLVETMAAARWRLLRVLGMQKAGIDRDMALQDPAIGPAHRYGSAKPRITAVPRKKPSSQESRVLKVTSPHPMKSRQQRRVPVIR